MNELEGSKKLVNSGTEHSGGVGVESTRPALERCLTWGENRNREPGQVHVEWHAPCGCAFHPNPFPHVHPCTNEHKRPDLHALTEESERERVLRRRRAIMADYDRRLEDWLS